MFIKVTFDTKAYVRALEGLAKDIPRAERSALDMSIRKGRKVFYQLAAEELHLAKRLISKGSDAELSLSSTTSLIAYFRPARVTYNVKEVPGLQFNKSDRAGRRGVTVDMHILSGGGSHPLRAPNAFIMGGGRSAGSVFNRVEFGPGTHRRGLKSIRTTPPATVLGQESNPVRVEFVRVVEETLTTKLDEKITSAIEKHFG